MKPGTATPSDAQVTAAIKKAQEKLKKLPAELTLEQVKAHLEKTAGALTQSQLDRVRKAPISDVADGPQRPDGRFTGKEAHLVIKDNKKEAAEVRADFKRTKNLRGEKHQETYELMNQIKANKGVRGPFPGRQNAVLPGHGSAPTDDEKPEKKSRR